MKLKSAYKRFLLSGLFVFFMNSPVLGGTFSTEAQDGVDLYNEEEYSRALKSFEAARLADPEDGNVLYNLANTHYQLGNYDHAVEALQAAESAFNDPSMKQKSQYNLGNAYFRMGQLDRAIQAYKKALELDPKDIDSKFNLEFARKQKERARQTGQRKPPEMDQDQKPRDDGLNPSPPQESDNSEGKPEEEGQSSKTDSSKEDQDDSKQSQSAGEDPSKESDAPAQEDPDKKKQEQQMAKAMHEITSMNKDEADRWLNSLNEDLKKMSRRQVQGQMKDLFVEGDKDW